jgi:pilus assembly protein CpaE
VRPKLTILLASRSLAALKALGACFANVPGVVCSTKLITNGHTDPLHNVSPLPDVVLLRFDAEHLTELETLAESDAAGRPPLIVVGPSTSSEAFRLAVRAGAREFLTEPLNTQELIGAIERIRNEPRRSAANAEGNMTVVAGVTGGVGTSFLACNLAHALATETDGSGLLVDLDLSFAPVASFFNVRPERGLLEALAEVEALDEVALAGYVTKHRSGLRLIGATGKSLVFAKDIEPARFAALLDLMSTHYRYVVVDAPHCLDELTATAFGMAKCVLLVMQQSVMQLRNAVRLMNLLTTEIGVRRDRIRVVVNRYQKRSTVDLDAIKQTLGVTSVVVIPNHYASALASIDSGIPLIEAERGSPLGRAVLELQAEIRGVQPNGRGSFLRRNLPLFAKN